MGLWGKWFVAALVVCSAQAAAQTPAPSVDEQKAPDPGVVTTHAPTADDICHAIEQSAGEYGLPVEFFARVIWQESRFKARAVSPKGAEGIAQFMPATADFRGLADPFDQPAGSIHPCELR